MTTSGFAVCNSTRALKPRQPVALVKTRRKQGNRFLQLGQRLWPPPAGPTQPATSSTIQPDPPRSQYREAELKHGRLAMLAAVGWSSSELIHPSLSKLFGATNQLSPSLSGALTKAPSVLNGGLERVSYSLWAAVVFISAALEIPRMLTIAENPVGPPRNPCVLERGGGRWASREVVGEVVWMGVGGGERGWVREREQGRGRVGKGR
jgi:hypothetical protein